MTKLQSKNTAIHSMVSDHDGQDSSAMNGRKNDSTGAKQLKPNFYPPWAPRFWNGMRVSDFISLLAEGRFRVHPSRMPSLIPITGCAFSSSVLTWIQRFRYQKKIRNTALKFPPVFIVGHWRTGTTLLHELIGQDSQFTFPTTLDCFTPHHFLTSKPFLHWLVKILIPSRRPMDNMKLGVDHPQECDFALATLGVPTPYRRIAFPNAADSKLNLLAASRMDDDLLEELREGLTNFYQTLTFRTPKRLILKSPPHTARIAKLAEWFPGAKFIHLSRHPYSVVPSTMHLWRSLDHLHGFQKPKYDEKQLLNYVLDSCQLLYESYFAERSSIPADNLIELKFEEFVRDPIVQLEEIYDQFQLPGFEHVRAEMQSSLQQRGSHKMNPRHLSSEMRNAIADKLDFYFDGFGYSKSESEY